LKTPPLIHDELIWQVQASNPRNEM